MNGPFTFVKPHFIYLITLHYVTCTKLETIDSNVIAFTNKRKAVTFLNASNRKAKLSQASEYYTMEAIRTI